MFNKNNAGLAYHIFMPIVWLGFGGLFAIGLINKIPEVETKKIQKGYLNPGKLEIQVTDMDLNDKYEVIMNYDGKNYLLTLDEKGSPKIQNYEIKPAVEIIKKDY